MPLSETSHIHIHIVNTYGQSPILGPTYIWPGLDPRFSHADVYVHMHMHTHICIYICMHMCIDMYTQIDMCICIYMYICLCMYVYIYMHIWLAQAHGQAGG